MALARAAARREKEFKKSEEHKASRVQVNVIQPGDGFNFPRTGDSLSIHYTTELEDGTKIDNSYQRGQPLNIILGAGHVIPGYVACYTCARRLIYVYMVSFLVSLLFGV